MNYYGPCGPRNVTSGLLEFRFGPGVCARVAAAVTQPNACRDFNQSQSLPTCIEDSLKLVMIHKTYVEVGGDCVRPSDDGNEVRL